MLAAAADAGASTLTATPLTPSQRVSGAGAATSRIVQTAPALLDRDDATRIPVVVKLDYDPIASYAGQLPSLPATSPAVTRRRLDRRAVESGPYARHVRAREATIIAAIRARLPDARIGTRLDVVYGGVALTLPANEVKDLLAVDGVIAVQADELRQPTTDSSPEFLAAPPVWTALGGQATAGAGTLFASLDTGVWPEHPSFAANPALPAPPKDTLGDPLVCDFGDNPLTPANDPFVCNQKLVGGRAFLAAYHASHPPEVYATARDSNGHGTHTASTAAGNPVDATVLGIARGPISGLAPGAAVIAYKVCGTAGCFSSDTAAAVQRAILDGVDVINFSISGGREPFADVTELAFLDAYAAGVVVVASAGNSGPAAGTVEHHGPWLTTVAASTQRRTFASTLTLSAGGDTLALAGASLTPGLASNLPVVLASAPPYSDPSCSAAAPPGVFTGRIVACQLGGSRVLKGFSVLQGGAAGLILYDPNPAPATNAATDPHWLPAIHVADGPALLTFLASHPDATGTFTQGTPVDGTADVVATFSSRGPGGLVLKPDVSAPGFDIVAGQTPTPDSASWGPPGAYFRPNRGTSMSAPHVAGAALLLRASHPTWTPGQVHSALRLSATPTMLETDLSGPAGPFARGAGRIDVARATDTRLTFDETAARFADVGAGVLHAIDLNLPSINVPAMPGSVTTMRTATNPTGKKVSYKVTTTAPAGSSITVTPKKLSLAPNGTKAFRVTITSRNAGTEEFGEIVLTPNKNGGPVLRLPVAFATQQGGVTLASDCTPAATTVGGTPVTCTLVATNATTIDTTATLVTQVSSQLKITAVAGGLPFTPKKVSAVLALTGLRPGVPSIAPGALFGYIPLSAFGVVPIPIGDEEIVNFNTPPFWYGGLTYSSVGVSSNGYLVVGGGTAADNDCCNPVIPSPLRPNNVLAPLWTDLDGASAPGVLVSTLTDGVSTWLVVEWRLNAFGTSSLKTFQVWIGVNGVEDITYAYDPGNLPSAVGLGPWVVGAENFDGSNGAALPPFVLPTQDLRVTSTPVVPGGSATLEITAQPKKKGAGLVATQLTTPVVRGTTVVTSTVTVTKP
ncbi:MAG: S8 family serine peptidase [bacterium]|nr:S8 family serine peptidase [bacterium]